MVSNFYIVVDCVHGFVGCHAGIVVVCRFLSFGGTSADAGVCGDCLVVGGLRSWETFVFDVCLHVAWMIWVCFVVSLGSSRCA
jgi:hypothetical protein